MPNLKFDLAHEARCTEAEAMVEAAQIAAQGPARAQTEKQEGRKEKRERKGRKQVQDREGRKRPRRQKELPKSHMTPIGALQHRIRCLEVLHRAPPRVPQVRTGADPHGASGLSLLRVG